MTTQRHINIGWLTVMLVGALASSARAELPQCFDVVGTNDDYRVSSSFTTGVWNESQISFYHRLSLQIPLWGAAVGTQLSLAHATGELQGHSFGNLRLFLQYFYSFEWARRANLWVGGGLDLYAPTATALDSQNPLTPILTGVATGDVALAAPDLSFGMRPRLHIAGEAWIFSVQVFGGIAIHFLDSQVRSAFEWGINISAQATDWLVLFAEGTGVSWIVAPPVWMSLRLVNLGSGLRFVLPSGFLLGVMARAPAAGGQTIAGEGVFIGVELTWRHDRGWILF